MANRTKFRNCKAHCTWPAPCVFGISEFKELERLKGKPLLFLIYVFLPCPSFSLKPVLLHRHPPPSAWEPAPCSPWEASVSVKKTFWSCKQETGRKIQSASFVTLRIPEIWLNDSKAESDRPDRSFVVMRKNISHFMQKNNGSLKQKYKWWWWWYRWCTPLCI